MFWFCHLRNPFKVLAYFVVGMNCRKTYWPNPETRTATTSFTMKFQWLNDVYYTYYTDFSVFAATNCAPNKNHHDTVYARFFLSSSSSWCFANLFSLPLVIIIIICYTFQSVFAHCLCMHAKCELRNRRRMAPNQPEYLAFEMRYATDIAITTHHITNLKLIQT